MTRSPFLLSLSDDPAVDYVVTHEAITCRARELWEEQGCPENCDEAIWLEAEAELLAIRQRRYRHPNLEFVNRVKACSSNRRDMPLV